MIFLLSTGLSAVIMGPSGHVYGPHGRDGICSVYAVAGEASHYCRDVALCRYGWVGLFGRPATEIEMRRRAAEIYAFITEDTLARRGNRSRAS